MQVIRLVFDRPQHLRRVWLHFAEPAAARTQEFVLRWGTGDGQPAREVLRQQWVFHPKGSTHETEDYRVDLHGATVLELAITPDVAGGEAEASLAELRAASLRAGRVRAPTDTAAFPGRAVCDHP